MDFVHKFFTKHYSLVLLTVGLVFTFINYSKSSWTYFYGIGGLPLAKVAPEGLGVFSFSILAFLAWKHTKPSISFYKGRIDMLLGFCLAILAIVVRLTQLKLYFFQDDYWFWLCRTCGGYTVFRWEPWLSSHPGLAWEVTRYFAGFHTIPYEAVILLSNASFVVGLYILARYVSKSKFIGFFSAFFFLSTTLNFDAFRWISHVIGFGWQGLFMTLAITALVYELHKFKGKRIPLTAVFLIMAAVGSGTVRTGAALFILSFMDVIVSFSRFSREKIWEWARSLFRRQAVYVLFPIIFAYVRELIGSAAKNGMTAPLHKPFPFLDPLMIPVYKLFLFVVGIFILPPELEEFLRSFISSRKDLALQTFLMNVFGSIYGTVAFLYIVLMTVAIAILIKKRREYLLIVLGLIWTLCFALYFTYFGSDLPVTRNTIWAYVGPHYLAYTSSAGISLVVGFYLFSIFSWIRRIAYNKLKMYVLATSIPLLLFFFLMILQINILEIRYNDFSRIAPGQQITPTQFFFETYRKIIPSDKHTIIIVYDDVDAIQRPGAFHPDSRFFQAFWPGATITILEGSKELQKFLLQKKDGVNDYSLDDIYYIITDYQNNGTIIDMSTYLRDKIKNTADISQLQIISESDWKQIVRENTLIKLGTTNIKRSQTIPTRINPADLVHIASASPFPVRYETINPDSGWRDYPYQMKRFIEKQELSVLRFFPQLKEKYLQVLLQERLMELVYVANTKDVGNIEKATNRYASFAGELTDYTIANKWLYKDEINIVYSLLLRHVATIEPLLSEYDFNTSQWRFIKQDVDSLKLYANKLKH